MNRVNSVLLLHKVSAVNTPTNYQVRLGSPQNHIVQFLSWICRIRSIMFSILGLRVGALLRVLLLLVSCLLLRS
jgi:hypothetical protein